MSLWLSGCVIDLLCCSSSVVKMVKSIPTFKNDRKFLFPRSKSRVKWFCSQLYWGCWCFKRKVEFNCLFSKIALKMEPRSRTFFQTKTRLQLTCQLHKLSEIRIRLYLWKGSLVIYHFISLITNLKKRSNLTTEVLFLLSCWPCFFYTEVDVVCFDIHSGKVFVMCLGQLTVCVDFFSAQFTYLS